MFELKRRGWSYQLGGDPWITAHGGVFSARELCVEIGSGEVVVYIRDVDGLVHHGVNEAHPVVAKAIRCSRAEHALMVGRP